MSVLNFHSNRKITVWVVVALGFSIPFSTAAANLLLLALLVLWLTLPGLRERLQLFWQNPVARAALFLFLALTLACLWGEAPPSARLHTLLKYGDLLLIGVLAGLLPDAEKRENALKGFAAGMTLLLLLSVSIWLGLLPEGLFGVKGAGAVVLRLSITHNWLMACFALLMALWASQVEIPSRRRALALLAGLASLNVLFMVGGRTGYLVLLLLLGYGLMAWKGWRGLVLAAVVVGALGAIILTDSSRLAKRIDEVVQDVRHWKPGEGASIMSSQGQRLDWYRASLELIGAHPLLGVGTGSFPVALEKHLGNSAIIKTTNPHNEYLMLAVQMGLPGMALFLVLLLVAWRSAPQLVRRDAHMLRCMVIAMASGCLFNSFLLDFAEGLFFAWMTGVLTAGLRVAQKKDEKNAALASRV